MAETSSLALIGSALAGGGLVGIINFVMNWQNKKSEEKRHLRELMFNAALEQWKQACILAIERMKIGQNTAVPPLDSYMVHMLKISEVLIDGNIDKHNIAKKLNEVNEVSEEVIKYIKAQEEKDKEAKVKKTKKHITTRWR